MVSIDELPEVEAGLDALPEVSLDELPETTQKPAISQPALSIDDLPEVSLSDLPESTGDISSKILKPELDVAMHEGYDKYWADKKKALEEAKGWGKAKEYAITGLEGVAFGFDKINSPVRAAINAAETGRDWKEAYAKEMVGGQQDKDILASWTPQTEAGINVKGAANLGAAMISPGALAKVPFGLTKLAGVMTKAKGLEQAADKGIDFLNYVRRGEDAVINSTALPLIGMAKGVAIGAEKAGLPKVTEAISKGIKENEKVTDVIRFFQPMFERSANAIKTGEEYIKSLREGTGMVSQVAQAAEQTIRKYSKGSVFNFKSQAKTGQDIMAENLGLEAKMIKHTPPEKWTPLQKKIVELNNYNKGELQNIAQEVTALAKASGLSAKKAAAMNINKLVEDVARTENYFPRQYSISPATSDKKEIQKIVDNLSKMIRAAKQRGQAVDLATGPILLKFKRAYEKKLNTGIVELDDLKGIPDKEYVLDMINEAKPKRADLLTLGGSSSFQRRKLPDAVVPAFEPKTDIYSYIEKQSEITKSIAGLKSLVSHMKGQSPDELALAFEGLKKYANSPVTKAGKAAAKRDNIALLKDAQGMLPSIHLKADDADYLAHVYHGAGKADKFAQKMEEVVSYVPFYRDAISAWKTWKINSIASSMRNATEYLSRGAQHGIPGEVYTSNLSKVYRWGLGETDDLSPLYKKRVNQVLGGQTSLSYEMPKRLSKTSGKPVDLLKPTKLRKPEKANKMFALEKAAKDYWDNLGRLFKSPDDSLRWSMYETKLKELSQGKPIEMAMADDIISNQALKYVDENTISYDLLPAATRMGKQINPFFSFATRAPGQHLKAFMKDPAFTARMKAAPEKFSREQQEEAGMSSEFKRNYKQRRNALVDMLSPVGFGDVFLGKTRGDRTVQLNTAPFNVFTTRTGQETYGGQIVPTLAETAQQYLGVGGEEMTFINPALAMTYMGQIFDALSGKADDTAIKKIVQDVTPAEFANMFHLIASAPFLPRGLDITLEKFYGKNVAGDPTQPGTALSRWMGFKPKIEKTSDITASRSKFIENVVIEETKKFEKEGKSIDDYSGTKELRDRISKRLENYGIKQ